MKPKFVVVVLLGGSALSAFGNGFRLPNQDPEAIARGNAFTATADNPAAIYYNPAGITQLEGQQVRAGVYLISTGVDYKALDGSTHSPDSSFQPVPQLYYVNSPKDSQFSFGLGVYLLSIAVISEGLTPLALARLMMFSSTGASRSTVPFG